MKKIKVRRGRLCERCHKKIMFADDRKLCGTCQREVDAEAKKTKIIVEPEPIKIKTNFPFSHNILELLKEEEKETETKKQFSSISELTEEQPIKETIIKKESTVDFGTCSNPSCKKPLGTTTNKIKGKNYCDTCFEKKLKRRGVQSTKHKKILRELKLPTPTFPTPYPYQRKCYNLRFLLKSQYWSTELLRELQLEGFKAITNFARTYCPYYKDLPEVTELDDIKNFPILTKTDIRHNFNEILVKNIPHQIEETGGTVSRVKIARDGILIKQMGLKRYMTWYGLKKHQWRTAHLWGSVEGGKFIHNPNFLWMPVEQLNSKDMAEKYLKALKRMSPDFFHGYALPLATLAHYANELNIHPFCKVIRSECETLTSNMRNEIETAFKTKYGLFNLYGSRDLGAMAQDCHKHKDLHIQAERYIMESVDGRLLYTDMFNYAFPLIRYENQDIGEFGEPCDCGINLPTLKPIIGRVLHYIKNKKDSWVSAFVFYLPINYHDIHHKTKIFDWIESFQIKQRKIGKITLLLKPWHNEKVPNNLTILKKTLSQYIHSEDFDIKIEVVDKLPLSKSGKQVSVDTTLLREWEK